MFKAWTLASERGVVEQPGPIARQCEHNPGAPGNRKQSRRILWRELNPVPIQRFGRLRRLRVHPAQTLSKVLDP
jgi:hypothetical protein